MTEALAVQSDAVSIAEQSMSVPEVVARVRKVGEVMEAVMIKGVHYGQIPGTPKPSLWQPGAEKLLMTFKLAPDLEIEDLSTADAIRYRVFARIRHIPTGEIVGMGVGEASSDEEKYRWRRAVCEEEFNETSEDRRRTKWAKKKNGGTYTVQQIRTEPADIANTVLKMAKKRALVDGAKSTCAASDIFDQDIEDLKQAGLEVGGGSGSAREVSKPTAKPAEVTDARQEATPPPATTQPKANGNSGELFSPADSILEEVWAEVRDAWHDRGVISEKQMGRLFAIAKGQNWASSDVEKAINDHLACTPEEIPWGAPYEKICELFGSIQPEA